MKKKIFIIINHLLYIKNFIYTGAFIELEKKYDCYYILEKNLKPKNIQNILGKKNYDVFKKKNNFKF